MGLISTTQITNGSTQDATPVNGNFTTIANEINGNWSTANFASAATNLSTVAQAVAWSAFTPTFTGITVGNGVFDCAQMTVGKTILARYKFTFGTTSAVTAGVTVTSPAAAIAASSSNALVNLEHNGVSSSPGKAVLTSTSVFAIYAQNSAGTYILDVDLSSTIPFTWDTGDIISFDVVIQKA